MTKTDHVDFEEQELRQAIERDVAAAGLWDTCAECGLAPEKELALINERLVEGGYGPFGTLSDLRSRRTCAAQVPRSRQRILLGKGVLK